MKKKLFMLFLVILLVAPTYAIIYTTDPRLVAFWVFNETSGSPKDLSWRHRYNLTALGTPINNAGQFFNVSKGSSNSSPSSFWLADIVSNMSVEMKNYQKNVSLVAFIYPNNTGTQTILFGALGTDSLNNHDGWHVGVDGNCAGQWGDLNLVLYAASNAYCTNTGIDTIPLQPTCIGAVVRDKTLDMYYNGTFNSTTTVVSNMGTTNLNRVVVGGPFAVGAAATQYWRGQYGYISIWNASLTETDIREICNNGIKEPTAPTAPSISVLFPNNTYNETYSTLLWVNISVTQNANCSLNLTDFTLNSSNGTRYSWSENDIANGKYSYRVNCSNENGADAKTGFFTKDDTSPTITYDNPTSGGTIDALASSTYINVTLQDNIGLYSISINITRSDVTLYVYNFSTILTNSSTYYNHTVLINISEWANKTYSMNTKVCDGHTLKEIPDAKVIKDKEKLIFQFDDDNIITINAIGSETADFKKSTDRYTYSFNYNNPGIRTIRLTATQPLTRIKSKYPGHFITGNEWVDFAPYNDLIVTYVDEYNYEITIPSDTFMSFNSIGQLNCVAETITFDKNTAKTEYYDINLLPTNWYNSDVFDTSTTSGALMFIFAFMIFIALAIIGELTRIPFIIVFAGLFGFFFSLLVYATVTAILGVILAGFSVLYIIRAVYVAR